MSTLHLPWEMIPLFFLVAFLYSSVGHGGATGYLALFVLFGIISPLVVPIALVLNILVASTSFGHYFKNGYFSWEMFLPLVLLSMPAAFLGGLLSIPRQVFIVLLGVVLLLSAVRLFLLREIERTTAAEDRKKIWTWGIPLGGSLGLLAGMTGIGGGVFLSPLLLFLRWADVKRTAALSSGFIVLNSLSGLVAHSIRGTVDWASALPLGAVVLAGGFIGAYVGAVVLNPKTMQGMLAIILLVAAMKLLYQAFST